MTSILVLRRGGLGDTLLMLPVLRALRRAHPEAALHFAGVREFADVLHAHGAVDVVVSSEDLLLWALGAVRGDEARARLRPYALVIADDPAAAAAAGAGSEVRVLDLAVRSPEPFGLQLARRIGLEPRWPEDAVFAARRAATTPGPVVLAPGSGARHKCWPRDRWLELAERLAACGEGVQVVVGPVEIERDDPRHWLWPVPVAFVVETSLPALASRLEGARAFVGNDSGTTHLAASLSVPTVALFGPTDPRVWAPPGQHVRVVEGPSGRLDRLSAAAVLESLA